MKYLLYRFSENGKKDATKHELAAVEFGRDFDEATIALIKATTEDLSCMPEYKNYKISAQVMGESISHRGKRRYDYTILGIVYPTYAKQNILIEYGVVEKEE